MARRKVLVVDDNQDLRDIFVIALSVAGYDVSQAENGLEALRHIDGDPPDAIVLDLGMPRISGYDVLADLQAQALTRDIAVVVVTGSVEPLDHLDVACVLRKPVSAQEIVASVERCIAALRQTSHADV